MMKRTTIEVPRNDRGYKVPSCIRLIVWNSSGDIHDMVEGTIDAVCKWAKAKDYAFDSTEARILSAEAPLRIW